MIKAPARIRQKGGAVRLAAAAAGFGVLVVSTSIHPADARGGHGFGHGHAGYRIRSATFAGGHRYGNDSYIKATSDERDKLLNTQIKSICRGC